MPCHKWIVQLVRNSPCSFSTRTCPDGTRPIYFSTVCETRSWTYPRSASPTSRFFPVTCIVIARGSTDQLSLSPGTNDDAACGVDTDYGIWPGNDWLGLPPRNPEASDSPRRCQIPPDTK